MFSSLPVSVPGFNRNAPTVQDPGGGSASHGGATPGPSSVVSLMKRSKGYEK
jgi:hypothetical protein